MDPETGRIKLIWELIAGGTAGGCQVVRVFGGISTIIIDLTFIRRFLRILLRLCKLCSTPSWLDS